METKSDTVTKLFEQLHPLLMQQRCYYDFKRICEKIDTLIRQNYAVESDPEKKITLLHAASALTHTIGKEVYFIKDHQDKMHKKNAAKIRGTEYFKAVNEAYDQVHSDIQMILIDEKNEKKKDN